MTMILDPSDEAAANGSAHTPVAQRGEARPRISKLVTRGDFWRDRARKKLRRGGLDADAAWEAYWRQRKAAAPPARLLHAAGSPLAWGCRVEMLSEESRALVDVAQQLARRVSAEKFAKGKRLAKLADAVVAWLDAAHVGDTNVDFAVGCLAAAHVLHELGAQLGAEQGWAVLDFLVATAEEAAPWTADVDGPPGAALAQQLVAGELPLTLAYFFPEMAPVAALARVGRNRLADGLEDLLGDEGLVRAGHLEVLRPLVACWTRSRAVGSKLKQGAWNRDAQRQFESAVRQAIRWTNGDGGLPLATSDVAPWSADFLAAAVRLGGRKADAVAARALLARTPLVKELPTFESKPPKPATLSESGALSLLRTDWSPRATSVAVDFSALSMRVEIASGGQPLFEGVWSASSTVDGKLLQAAGAWEEVCWFTDGDVDYIEFRLNLTEGARLERQILLARTDGFLLLADHLQNPSTDVLEHAWQLPLTSRIEACAELESRDVVLRAAGKDVARLLPLALPEWRLDPRGGELTIADYAVHLHQRVAARAVACPLFVDLTPRRVGKPCTWRQLTVAEALQIQPPDVAVGYRVQCDRNQWMIYRSQAPRGNRTLLGQNTSCEFLVARFLSPSGAIEELVQVQG